MKLHSTETHVEKSPHLTTSTFGIKSTAKAFSILSGALYSDKPLAIVRELSCNAWDAHVAAKNAQTKFEIKLPTSLDPTFYVKDYGTGLSDYDIRGGWYNKKTGKKVSHLDAKWKSAAEAVEAGFEEVGGLYTTYFDSTKDKSNDFIGALGLGSKSPFSYVSTFSVESRHNGVKRLYSAFVGDGGVPAISLLGEQKSDEPSGMTISLATKLGDAEKFRAAAMKALMYFDPLPKVTGGGPNFKPHELKHTVQGTNWKMRETGYYAHMEGSYVLQGFVVYPIDRDILSQSGLPSLCYKILQLDIDFAVPLGSVEIAPSREALSYTPETIKNLMKSVEVAADEMRGSVQKQFDACQTLWDARLLYSTFTDYDHKMHELFDELDRAKAFTYKGKKLDDEALLELTKIKNTQLQVAELPSYTSGKAKVRVRGRWDPDNTAKTFTVALKAGMTVLIDDTFSSGPILSEYLTDRRPKDARGNLDDAYVLVIKGTTKNSYKQAEVDSIIKMLGNPNVTYVSSLSYVKAKSKTTYRARKMDEVVKWKGFPTNGGYRKNQLRRSFSRLCWTGMKLDTTSVTDDVFYVELDRFTIIRKGKEQMMFDVLLKAAIEVGILDKDVKIIGLNEKQAARVKTNKHFHNVFEYCEDEFANLDSDKSMTNKIVASSVLNQIGNGIARHIVLDWSNVRDKIVDGSFKDLIDDLDATYTSSKKCKLDVQKIQSAAESINQKFLHTCKEISDKQVEAFNKMMSKHSMLRLVNWAYVERKDVAMIIDYVNFVAKG